MDVSKQEVINQLRNEGLKGCNKSFITFFSAFFLLRMLVDVQFGPCDDFGGIWNIF